MATDDQQRADMIREQRMTNNHLVELTRHVVELRKALEAVKNDVAAIKDKEERNP